MKKKVFVINKSGHDFSPAKRFGDLVYLSEGVFPKYNISHMYRIFTTGLMHSHPKDFILQTSLPIMNIVACVIFALKHRRLNLLLFENGRYISRTLVFDSIEKPYTQLELDELERHNRKINQKEK